MAVISYKMVISHVLIGKPGVCDRYIVGQDSIKDIKYYSPPNEHRYVDIEYDNGDIFRNFHVMEVFYKKVNG